MEQAGTWNDASVLISADHSWRIGYGQRARVDARVPFIVKLANRQEGVVYTTGLNTVVTHDLLLDLLHLCTGACRPRKTSPDGWMSSSRPIQRPVHPPRPSDVRALAVRRSSDNREAALINVASRRASRRRRSCRAEYAPRSLRNRITRQCPVCHGAPDRGLTPIIRINLSARARERENHA